MSRKQVPSPKKSNSSKNKSVTSTEKHKKSYDDMNGRIVFTKVNNHKKCPIDKIQGTEFKLLIECFKIIESLTWNEIKLHNGLNFERNRNIAIPLPQGLPPDAKLCSMRVDGKFRIYGYRAQEFFYIIWIDRNHEVCPLGKNKKYTA